MKPVYKNGIVREVDGARGLARVEFPDEDGVASWWLSVNCAFAGASKSYAMPEIGSQVSCITDERGEEGVILGAVYSARDTPPGSDPDEIVQVLAGGREERYNKKTGEMTIRQTAGMRVEIGQAVVEILPGSIMLSVGGASLTIADGRVSASGDMAFEGGSITHDGRNIGASHVHGGVKAGSARTQPPE